MTSTHKVWRGLCALLADVHGERIAPPNGWGDILGMLGQIEDKYKTFELKEHADEWSSVTGEKRGQARDRS